MGGAGDAGGAGRRRRRRRVQPVRRPPRRPVGPHLSVAGGPLECCWSATAVLWASETTRGAAMAAPRGQWFISVSAGVRFRSE
ncbi:hypothetical protein ACFFX0_12360 [Citricoccus parietis]|uniref:Uncharacterized protein n=1 Tax=Citricoccus parietis TaxID=592307 RepID=A0ABV5FZ37_9MICC